MSPPSDEINTDDIDFQDATPLDFESPKDGMFFVYDRTAHSFLAIFPKEETEEDVEENKALCIFTSKEDADECIVSWNYPQENLVTFEIEDDKQLLFFLWNVIAQFRLFTFNPPLEPNRRATCYMVEDLLEYAVNRVGV